MTITEILALLDSDPAAGILAVANLREERASAAAGGGGWHLHETDDGHEIRLADTGAYESQYTDICYGHGLDERDEDQWDLAVLIAEHIAAEASPAHALAAVALWRTVAEMWEWDSLSSAIRHTTVADVRAYLGGVS